MADHGRRMPVIPDWLDDMGLSQAEFRVYCRIARRSHPNSTCFESAQKIAEACGMNRKTLYAALDSLEELGMITRCPKPGKPTVMKAKPAPINVEEVVPDSGQPKSVPGTPNGTAGGTRNGTGGVPNEGTEVYPTKYSHEVIPDTHTPESSPDYDEAVESWNAFAETVGLPQVRSLNAKRRQKVRARWDDLWPEIEAVYSEIRNSRFLLGKDGGWSCTFDWIWHNDTNYLKVLEGQYRDKQKSVNESGETPEQILARYES